MYYISEPAASGSLQGDFFISSSIYNLAGKHLFDNGMRKCNSSQNNMYKTMDQYLSYQKLTIKWPPSLIAILRSKNSKLSLAYKIFGLSAPKLGEGTYMPPVTLKCFRHFFK